MDDLARLAALYGVATTYQPAEDVTVRVPEATIAAVLRQLGVDTDTPESLRAHLYGAEREAAGRLLPKVLVWWAGARPPAELAALGARHPPAAGTGGGGGLGGGRGKG